MKKLLSVWCTSSIQENSSELEEENKILLGQEGVNCEKQKGSEREEKK